MNNLPVLPDNFTDEDRAALATLNPMQQQLYIQIKTKQFQNLQKPEHLDTTPKTQRPWAEGAGVSNNPPTMRTDIRDFTNNNGFVPNGDISNTFGFLKPPPAPMRISFSEEVDTSYARALNVMLSPNYKRAHQKIMIQTSEDKYEFLKNGVGGAFAHMKTTYNL